MRFAPFGLAWDHTVEDEIGYTGHKHDTNIGLTYMQARYYDPVIGRFYSNDPVDVLGHMQRGNSIAHGFNRYAYANNNPYKYVDPDGKYGYNPAIPAQNDWLRNTPSGKATVKATQLVAGFIPVLGDTLAVAEMVNEAALGDVPLDNATSMAASKGTEKLADIGFDDFVESGSPKKAIIKSIFKSVTGFLAGTAIDVGVDPIDKIVNDKPINEEKIEEEKND